MDAEMFFAKYGAYALVHAHAPHLPLPYPALPWSWSLVATEKQTKVSALTSLKYVDAWCVFFWATTPTLVTLLTFATLVIVRGEGAPPLKVSSVFAGGMGMGAP